MVTILIIEDNITILENTTEFLEMEGYKVGAATNGKQGLDKIFEIIPDLIICDFLIPGMNGLDVLKMVGKNQKCKRIPFLLFSAKTEKKDIKIGLDAGADGYVSKPFDLDELVITIERCLKNGKVSNIG
tara:strand:+ start:448 stop:834 length:387 start_codon:yes stop_codon:yes gene_type:complete